MGWRSSLLFLGMLSLCCVSQAFYLPWLAPTNYCKAISDQDKEACKGAKNKVYVHVNKLDSVVKIIPYEYNSFDFCEAQHSDTENRDPVENLGQVVFGERLRASPYNISFGYNTTSTLLCEKTYKAKEVDNQKLNFLRERIHEAYMHQWVVDNMPVTWCYSIMENDKPFCTMRFPVGCYVSEDGQRHDACFLSDQLSERGATYVFNHVNFILAYHKGTLGNGYRDGRIVRAQVQLASCETYPCMKNPKGKKVPNMVPQGGYTIQYSYSVQFVEMESVRWATRWDYILSPSGQEGVQWFSFMNSFFITGFFAAVVGIILWRSTHIDFLKLNQSDSCVREDVPRDFRWTLLHGDVFRPPSCTMLLSVCVGSGAQILIMTSVVLAIACLGFLSPPNRGALTSTILVVYPFLGGVGGYVSARLYKLMRGCNWMRNALMSAFFVPGVVFAIFFFLNLLLWGASSSAAIPFSTLLTLLCLWFGISLPLTLIGSLLGFKKQVIEQPVRTNLIPREIPKQKCCFHPVFTALVVGIVPFFCVFIQIFVIFNSIWQGQMYVTFGFMTMAYLILILLCAELSIIQCYLHLGAQDYRWWWRSFFSPGTFAFWFFLFSLRYFVYKTSFTGILSYLLFFGYTFIMVFLSCIVTGSVGFIACLLFIRKIYGNMEVNSEALSTTTYTTSVL